MIRLVSEWSSKLNNAALRKVYAKRLLLAATLALLLAVADLYIINLSVYFMAFWVAWSAIKE